MPSASGRRSPGGRRRRALRRVLLGAIAVLYVVSIPWYRGDDGPLRLVFGLPDWVALALACYAGVAVLNACAWMLAEVPDAPPGDAKPGARAGRRDVA